MPSVFKGVGDETFPGHTLLVHNDEYGAFHLSCSHSFCEWEQVEIDEDDVIKSWYLKHYVHAFFHEEHPLSFLNDL